MCDGNCRTYLALCQDETMDLYGYEGRLHQSCKSKFLTVWLFKKLSTYYSTALHEHYTVEEMQKAVMATCHRVTSTRTLPTRSWCRYQAAEAQGKPPQERAHQACCLALLPVYQKLSEAQLLSRCLGKKTQNAAGPCCQKTRMLR